jgi:hypothetical protein
MDKADHIAQDVGALRSACFSSSTHACVSPLAVVRSYAKVCLSCKGPTLSPAHLCAPLWQEGRRAGDAAVGRYLADTLAVVPALAAADFEALFNEGVQDQLLVSYLANLVRSQLSLAERLGTAALPLM